MTQPEQTLASQQATVADALDLNSLTLIGLFSTTEGPAALIRSADGQVARVVPGEQALGITATAIGDAQVLVTGADGVTLAMRLPPRD
ncbi:hypothetical protein [Yoonia sp.]|uniref:hypothetical protein n=1 Tax=Yoonia sp. TaxID=2212373 RepID=UPI00391B57EF